MVNEGWCDKEQKKNQSGGNSRQRRGIVTGTAQLFFENFSWVLTAA